MDAALATSDTTRQMGGRVSQACTRCRRQKLRCDPAKPCTNCIRANAECRPRNLQHVTRHRCQAGAQPRRQIRSDQSTERRVDTHVTEHASPSDIPINTRHEDFGRVLGANSSSMNFARNVLGRRTIPNPSLATATTSDSASPRSSNCQFWNLKFAELPPKVVLDVCLVAYVDRVHWFHFLLHEPTLWTKANRVLSTQHWTVRDRPDVLLLLMTAIMGLQSALSDDQWTGYECFRSYSIEGSKLLQSLVQEVRYHLLDLLDDCQIETAQVTLLMGCYYMYTGSPNLAWSMIGMSSRTAYALGLNKEPSPDQDPITSEVQRRCWKELCFTDTFSSMVYGRPCSLDFASSGPTPSFDMDDITISHLSEILNSAGDPSADQISMLSFHLLKYDIYNIMAKAIRHFESFNAHQSAPTADIQALIQVVGDIEREVESWRRRIPSVLRYDLIVGCSDLTTIFDKSSGNITAMMQSARPLVLQSVMLQVFYDSTLMFLRRPLLESRISALQAPQNYDASWYNLVCSSLYVARDAALRLSRIPFNWLCNHSSASFCMIHMFTAGVILSIQPTSKPFTDVAQRSKLGILQIIQASRLAKSHSRISKLTEELLLELLEVTMKREAENALQSDIPSLPSYTVTRDESETSSDRSSQHLVQNLHFQPEQSQPHRLGESDPTSSCGYQLPAGATVPVAMDVGRHELHSVGVQDEEQLRWAFDTFGQAMFNLDSEHQQDAFLPRTWDWF